MMTLSPFYSQELFALFDRLILLSAGRVIYSGPIDKVVTYFESIGEKE